MAAIDAQVSTGLAGLDRVFRGIMAGDNIVWQADSIDDYRPLVEPFCQYARDRGRKLVYFHFARHPALVAEGPGVDIQVLDPGEGFEPFLSAIHTTIEQSGRGAYYVFDCLSDLVADWYSDQMLGNFFMLTCPYLYDLETIAYFALMRGHHSFHATAPILDTTQLFSDIYRHQGELYVRPLKVQQRYSPTMHLLHVWRGEEFAPVTDSVTISQILTLFPWSGLKANDPRLDIWNRTFSEVEEVVAAGHANVPVKDLDRDLLQRTLRMTVSRDERVMQLAERYLTLGDILAIRERMIGTGLIGGKAVGVMLARAILQRTEPRWRELLEIHDSFFVGSDVFYSYLVRNGCWWVRDKQKNPATFLDGAETARRRILRGDFPDYVMQQFSDMLDYFGQSPIIVRSSSLLEDNFGNAFAGKYDSVFCVNQGPREKRLDDLLTAVRTIYASTMSERALMYRVRRGILDRDEQMGLLVQRVSGAQHGNLFYPHMAGVGLSFNPYVWSEHIDPAAGMVRLVMGLGTRAVDRSDDDYTRVVSLSDPERRPESHFDSVRQYAQKRIDVLDLEANQLSTRQFADVAQQSPDLPLQMVATVDDELEQRARERGMQEVFPWVLTFEHLLRNTPFVNDMREMLRILQQAYDYPVDVEFTANFIDGGRYKIDLVQCRPFQVKEAGTIANPPERIAPERLVLEAHGAVIGHSRIGTIDRLVYVVPAVYSQLPLNERHQIARVIGQITRLRGPDAAKSLLLIGPGRWGTASPELGVPVRFAEINNAAVLCELVAMHEGLVPDVSLGTHFFSDLVETDILYLAVFPQRQDNRINRAFFDQQANRLAELLPNAAPWAECVRVIDLPSDQYRAMLRFNANTMKQNVFFYLDTPGAAAE
ncbi:MAG: pyruvate, phosphate dikinase [Candidatus Competibacteraceae bacterium]|nr:pyruvate, phosphate dikinase [Candidatus Competibacteraceae bacterium]MBK8962295.1 pyruvate, phosphate dikinase [Candidatus Competibacteraceae bacterium]